MKAVSALLFDLEFDSLRPTLFYLLSTDRSLCFIFITRRGLRPSIYPNSGLRSMATAASAAASISASVASSTPFQFSSLSEANSYRLKAIVERLTFIMNSRGGSIRFDSTEFSNLFVVLARGVDYALTINDVPAVAHRLPSLIKQAYQRRDESSLQPAIMLLMISVKNACKNGWFTTVDADELLKMANEFSLNFCMATSVIAGVGNAQDIISVLVSRFYPQFKMGTLIASFEAKPGYEILMSDFQIERNVPQEEKIMLIVVQTDNLETSSCIISPPQVSFLVNGKGVDRRTNVSLDNGPQFPTDIIKMLKFGSNIIQAIGYFSGTYLIALAFMSKIHLSNTPILKDYAQPVVVVGADSEIIEGASRITLNCPISFRRIKTPVKGHLCKHHQCFDYDNFMLMNSRKPAWRCPCCNQTVSFIDLRIDQNMVKILKEVDQDVINVVISADGSWKAGIEHNRSKDQPQQENISRQQDCHDESASTRSAKTSKVDVDLTIGEDGQSGSATSPSQVGAQYESFSQKENHGCETEDTKPFKDVYDLRIRQFLSETPLVNHATMITPLASQLLNLATMDAVAPALCVEPLAVLESSQTNFSHQQISQVRALAENMHVQPRFENLMIGHEPERLPIPRHVERAPIAVQALPVPAPPPSSFKRMRVNGPNSSSLNTNDSSSDAEMQSVFRTSDLSMTQDREHQTHQQVRSPALQHVVSLPAQNPISTRVASSLQRGSGAYRASLQPSSDSRSSLGSASDGQDPQRNPSSLRSLIMSGSFIPNVALPLGATRELARQVAQQKLQLQTGVNPQASRVVVPSAATADGLRLSGVEPSGNIADRPLDKNWQPTGRMRGSLTGSAYSAALTHYKPPTTQMNQAIPPASTVVPSASAQLPSNAQEKQQ